MRVVHREVFVEEGREANIDGEGDGARVHPGGEVPGVVV